MTDKDESNPEKLLYCSFCGKSQQEVKKLIAGPSVFICDECIELCNDIILEEALADTDGSEKTSSLPVPQGIREALDEYVIGQELAKRTLSVAVYSHYRRLHETNDDGIELSKSNILLVNDFLSFHYKFHL